MKNIIFNTSNLQVILTNNVKEILLSFKQQKEQDIETGGILMGQLYPKSNKIIVSHALTCEHNFSSRYRLNLNIKCLQKKMNEIWKNSSGTITYIGDWHTHPEKNPKPSFLDYKTFVVNYYKSKFNQNILLYLILGSHQNIWFKAFNQYKFKKVHDMKL